MQRRFPGICHLIITVILLYLIILSAQGFFVIPFSGTDSSTVTVNKIDEKTQYIVFKFDDLNDVNWKTWKTVTDIVIAKNVTAEIGLFVKSLTTGKQDYLDYVQSLVNDPEHFEIWMHGWTGDAKEFLETDYATQLDHFYKARTTMLIKYDYILRDFQDHYWGGNQNTVKIVNEDPFIKGWVYYQNSKEENVYGVKPEKQVMPILNVYMETGTGVISYEKFKSDWAKFKADNLPYLVIQGHPWGYRNDSLRAIFTKIVDDLIAKKVTFTHFNDYNKMIKGYSTDKTSPSVPEGLKANRLDNSTVKLTWNASKDQQSGVDCYKIYRDGICIDLSAESSYTDVVSDSHAYQVAAVNRNDLVSAKSEIVIASKQNKNITYDNVQLMLQFTGDWKFEKNQDTVSSREMKSFGNGFEGFVRQTAKGKTLSEQKQIWGYDPETKEIFCYYPGSSGILKSYRGSFIPENTTVMEQLTIPGEKKLSARELTLISPDKFTHITFREGLGKKSITFHRIIKK